MWYFAIIGQKGSKFTHLQPMQLQTYKLTSILILGSRIHFWYPFQEILKLWTPLWHHKYKNWAKWVPNSQICNQCSWRLTNFLQKLCKKVQIHKHTTNKQIWLENLKTSIYINFWAKNPFLITINSQCKHRAKQQHLQIYSKYFLKTSITWNYVSLLCNFSQLLLGESGYLWFLYAFFSRVRNWSNCCFTRCLLLWVFGWLHFTNNSFYVVLIFWFHYLLGYIMCSDLCILRIYLSLTVFGSPTVVIEYN